MSTGSRYAAAVAAGAATPATLAALHGAIKGRLAVVAAAFPLMATKDDGVQRAPTVIDGWLPPKTNADALDYPFIIIRPNDGTDDPQGADQTSTAAVELVIGVYGDENETWLDLSILIDAIRADLGEEPTIAGTLFEHVGPLTWEIPREQTRPEWLATVKTIWNVPRPERVAARNPQPEE